MRILLGLVCICALPFWTGCDDNVATPTNPVITDMRDMEIPIGGSSGGMMGGEITIVYTEYRNICFRKFPIEFV